MIFDDIEYSTVAVDFNTLHACPNFLATSEGGGGSSHGNFWIPLTKGAICLYFVVFFEVNIQHQIPLYLIIYEHSFIFLVF